MVWKWDVSQMSMCFEHVLCSRWHCLGSRDWLAEVSLCGLAFESCGPSLILLPFSVFFFWSSCQVSISSETRASPPNSSNHNGLKFSETMSQIKLSLLNCFCQAFCCSNKKSNQYEQRKQRIGGWRLSMKACLGFLYAFHYAEPMYRTSGCLSPPLPS